MDKIIGFVMMTNSFVRSSHKFRNTDYCSHIGADFQRFLSDKEDYHPSFNILDESLAGAKSVCDFVGCSRYQIELLLRICGAPSSPFVDQWEVPVSIVWRRLYELKSAL